jgi:hypothetical protein
MYFDIMMFSVVEKPDNGPALHSFLNAAFVPQQRQVCATRTAIPSQPILPATIICDRKRTNT